MDSIKLLFQFHDQRQLMVRMYSQDPLATAFRAVAEREAVHPDSCLFVGLDGEILLGDQSPHQLGWNEANPITVLF